MKRFLKSATLLVAAVMVLGLQSCNSAKPLDASKLQGYWVLKSLNQQDAKPLFEGPIPTLELNFADSLASGSAGCNRYFGKFDLAGSQFNLKAPGSTMMMCAFANQEDQFLKTLSTPNLTLSFSKEGLLTFTEGQKVVLEFALGEKPAGNVSAHANVVTPDKLAATWTLKSIAGGDLAKLFLGEKPTLVMTAEGVANGNAGCNNYRSSYKLDGSIITFGPIMSTKMACPSLAGEAAFSALLSNPLQASLDGNTLTLSKDGKTVLEFTK